MIAGFTRYYCPQNYTDGGIPFYIRRPSHILRLCLGMPSIAQALHRLPVVSSGCYRYVSFHIADQTPCTILIWISRELYHGERWHNDQRFQAPMVEVAGMSWFVNDFIQFQHHLYGVTCGKILKFFNVVSQHNYFTQKKTHWFSYFYEHCFSVLVNLTGRISRTVCFSTLPTYTFTICPIQWTCQLPVLWFFCSCASRYSFHSCHICSSGNTSKAYIGVFFCWWSVEAYDPWGISKVNVMNNSSVLIFLLWRTIAVSLHWIVWEVIQCLELYALW